MTVQEASKICFGKPYVVDVEEHEEAIKTIKEALAELEQYRAIGTPTQILERIGGLDIELGKYACIGTVEEVTNQKHNLSVAYKVIEELQKKDWIPCEVELPPQPKENPLYENKPLQVYLVSVKNCEEPFRAFWNGKDFTDGWSKLKVEAWMKLPAPYKKEGADNE